MITEMAIITAKWKVFVGCVAILVLGIADANVTPATLEDYTLKGLLLISVGLVIRQIMKERVEHRAEVETLRVQHKSEMSLILNEVKKSVDANTKATDEQIQYFRTVNQRLVDRGMNMANESTQRLPLP